MNGESKIDGNGTVSNGSKMNGSSSSTNQMSSMSFRSLSLNNLRGTITTKKLLVKYVIRIFLKLRG